MKILSALLGVALVVVSGLAIHLSREVDAGRQQVAGLKARMQELEARIASQVVQPVPQLSAPAAAAAPPATTPAEKAASSAPAAERTSAAAVQDLMAVIQAQRSSPEAMAQRRLTGRVLMEGSNPDVREALGLTPDEADKLLDLLVTHQERTSELFPLSGNSTMTPAERAAAVQARQRENEAELQAMLGSKYDQWKDYNETRAAWQQRRDLRAVLDAGGMPMTDVQSKSLIAALSAEQRSHTQQIRDAANQGRLPPSEVMARYTPERRQQYLDTAAPHLSPQQLEGYRGMLERAAAQEQSMLSTLQRAQDRARSEAGAAAAPR